jgi:hypothetical protein
MFRYQMHRTRLREERNERLLIVCVYEDLLEALHGQPACKAPLLLPGPLGNAMQVKAGAGRLAPSRRVTTRLRKR